MPLLLFQGPLLLSFQEDPLQQPLELAVQQVSSVARSAHEKVSWSVVARCGAFPAKGANFELGWCGSGGAKLFGFQIIENMDTLRTLKKRKFDLSTDKWINETW